MKLLLSLLSLVLPFELVHAAKVPAKTGPEGNTSQAPKRTAHADRLFATLKLRLEPFRELGASGSQGL